MYQAPRARMPAGNVNAGDTAKGPAEMTNGESLMLAGA
jgi:hypothetical protein